MLIPGILYLLVFRYYPMYGVVIAFQDFNPGLGFTESPWVGLENFEFLFILPNFGRILANTVIIAIAKIVTVEFFAILLAILLNEVQYMLFRRTIQIIIYLPHFLSWTILGGILIEILSPYGMVNQFLGTINVEPIMFLGSNDWFRSTLVLTNLWKEVGFSTIVYLAALTGINPTLHEAAAIDGANRWQRILHITLPGIRSTVVLLATLSLGNVLEAGFEQVLTLYNPAVYRTGDVLSTYIYREGLIAARYSLAGAVGLFRSLIGFGLITLSYWLAGKYANYRIF
jgi:putative aldouronate transport system permease protein